jgi:putative flippase GtrA
MTREVAKSIKAITEKKTLWQFIKFTLLSMVTTVVDLGTFALLNYLIFTQYSDVPFVWWLLDYGLEDGGLCAFLSFSLSFVISQTFNFFIQRKITFGATGNILRSGILYAVMVLTVFVLGVWIPTLIRAPIALIVGAAWADFIVKNINMTLSFAIQFPMNKWVIMQAPKPSVNKTSDNLD